MNKIYNALDSLRTVEKKLQTLASEINSLEFCESVLIRFDNGETEGSLITHEQALAQYREAVQRVLAAANS